MITLAATKREATQNSKNLRKEGIVPAVVYGPHQEAISISLVERDFELVLREAGEATIVALSGIQADLLPTLIHQVDLDPLTDRPRHVDFYAVTKGEKVEVQIPIEFIGESPAVKAGANLVKVLHEIEIEADPMNLPTNFVVDISMLIQIGDQIRVSDLTIPAGVELKIAPEEVIALIQEVVEEKADVPAVDLASIEVEKKGKEEEAGEAGPEEKK